MSDENGLINDLLKDLRRDIKRHLCFDLLRGVSAFLNFVYESLKIIVDHPLTEFVDFFSYVVFFQQKKKLVD